MWCLVRIVWANKSRTEWDTVRTHSNNSTHHIQLQRQNRIQPLKTDCSDTSPQADFICMCDIKFVGKPNAKTILSPISTVIWSPLSMRSDWCFPRHFSFFLHSSQPHKSFTFSHRVISSTLDEGLFFMAGCPSWRARWQSADCRHTLVRSNSNNPLWCKCNDVIVPNRSWADIQLCFFCVWVHVCVWLCGKWFY